MRNETEFKTIGNYELATAIGGDFASKWLGNLKQDWKDISARTAACRSAGTKGNVGGYIKNGLAGGLDTLGLVGDVVSPVAGIIGAKP